MSESQTQSQTDTTSVDDATLGEYRSTLPGILGGIDNMIAKIEAVLLAVGVLLMAANTIANVVGRFVFQNSLFFSEELNRILIIVITLVTAVFMFGLCWYAFNYLMTQAGRGRVLPSLQIPVWITLVWVPVGFFMTGMQYLLTAIKNILEKDIYLSTAVLEGYDEDEMEV